MLAQQMKGDEILLTAIKNGDINSRETEIDIKKIHEDKVTFNEVTNEFLSSLAEWESAADHLDTGRFSFGSGPLSYNVNIPCFSLSHSFINSIASGRPGLEKVKEQQLYHLIQIPNFDDCDFAVNVMPGIMLTTNFELGDVIFCEFVDKDEDWSLVRVGDSYLALFDNGPMIIKIERNNEHEELEFNNDYSPGFTSFKKSRITAMFRIKAVVKRLSL